MRIVTLSGWGQPYDALASVVPDARHLEYARHPNIEEALTAIGTLAGDAKMIVGWSLGGQLVVRAIAAGLLAPEKLVLIGTPFQFVKTEPHSLGMGRDTYGKFRDNYARNAPRTLKKAWELVHMNDLRSESVRTYMQSHDVESVLARDWLYWLDALDGYSCASLDFSKFPRTLLIHGQQDAVVSVEQAHKFLNHLPKAKLELLSDAGHAPHWHDSNRVAQLIRDM